MGWLRRLTGISRRQRKKNDDIRLELNQMDTLVQKIKRQAAVVRSCEADEQLKITSKSTGNIDSGYKKSEATKQEVD